MMTSPWVSEESVHDPGPLVLGREHHRLPDVVVLLLGAPGTAHHARLQEGGPRVSQQLLVAPLVRLVGGSWTHTHTHTHTDGEPPDTRTPTMAEQEKQSK